jgi:uncharacterized protein
MPLPHPTITTHALTNPHNRAVLDVLPSLVPDAWIVSGCVFQSVWNGLTGRAPTYGILDIDVFYFDPDTSYEAEDAVIKACDQAFAGLGVEVQARNQARVHLWYPQKFGRPYPALTHATESLKYFLAPCCAVALRLGADGPEIEAPFGLDDLLAMKVTRNHLVEGSSQQYDAKSARWKAMWPEISVEPWDAVAPTP